MEEVVDLAPEASSLQLEGGIVTPRLEEQLREVYSPDFSTLGHGTIPEVAEEIMLTGLRYKDPDLSLTAVPLYDAKIPYDEQSGEVVQKITHWPHKDRKGVVILMIPNPAEDQQGGNAYFNSVFEERPIEGRSDRYIIDPKYIKGYVDVEAGKFVPNPNFNPTPIVFKGGLQETKINASAVSQQVPIPSASGLSEVW